MSIKTQDAEEVAQNWSRVDWDNLLEKLSKAVEAIDVRQDESEKGRQHLLAESAHFRENTDKGLRKAALPLIKAFQGEVDRLTLRAKAAEAVVIDVCRKCTLVPDPSQYLEQIPSLTREVDRLRSAEEQLNLLKRQLNELREEYGDLQNQELTIRQLREQVKELETKSDSNVQAILSEKEKELRLELEAFKKEMSNKQDELTAENKRLTNAVTDLETKNKETNRILEETKLKVVKKEAVDDATLEMVTKDLENALQRAAEAEKDVQRLQYELERIGRSSMTSDEGVAEDSPLIRTKNIQIHKLLEKNKNLSFKLTELETESKRRIDELTQELERQVELVEQLRAQLQAQADYEDIKKELRILRSVEFGEESADGAGSIMTNGVNTSATATAEVQLGGRLKALDELLVGKNRKLQDENVELRMRNQSLEEEQQEADKEAVENVLQTVADAFGSDCSRNNSFSTLFANTVTQKSPGANGNLDMVNATNLISLFLSSASSSRESLNTDNSHTTHSFNIHEVPRTPAEISAYNELQAIISSNIKELGDRALKTAEIAKQCKKLMNDHNIGQRLFAKYVMNQSQGSLSELLSKPRHWEKLTDKGKEAFRRMYGWMSNPRAIELLCAVSPRRNQPLGSFKIETPPREILWDQQDAALAALARYHCDTSSSSSSVDESPQKQSSRNNGGDVKQRDRLSAVVTGTSGSTSGQRASRWRHDDISKEKIINIYQREMAKLKEQESHLEQAIGSRSSNPRVKDEKLIESTENSNATSSLPSPVCGTTSDSSSSPNLPLNSAQALFAAKCRNGMSPITQEQLERFAILDTDDVVRQIKEFLSKNSISQRQFGESVLGLSQGSVSDLLARPKPWIMLTQKGREPFIRMQLFLNEAQSVDCKPEPELNGNHVVASTSALTPNSGVSGASEQNITDALFSTHNLHFENEMANQGVRGGDGTTKQEDKKEPAGDYSKTAPKIRKEASVNDTNELVRQVRSRLHTNGISQKAFGDAVLGVSPGGVSELLSKPKPWEQLSPRARDLYLIMNDWLDEPNGITRVQASASSSSSSSSNTLPPSLTATLASIAESLSSKNVIQTKSVTRKRKATAHAVLTTGEIPKKAQRTVITDQQKLALKLVFERDQHPSPTTIEQLSRTLSLSTRTVSNWFHNYRTRQKKFQANLRAKNNPNGDAFQKRTIAKEKSSDDRWKQDLAELIKLESKPSSLNHCSPTMVASNSTNSLIKCGVKNSLLDKAIERIQKLNAAKQL